jgi:hypothetical protein
MSRRGTGRFSRHFLALVALHPEPKFDRRREAAAHPSTFA